LLSGVGTLNSAFRCARLPSTRLALWASGLEAHAVIGAIDGGGVCRIALTDADKAGRDQLVAWLRELGLEVRVDRIGNVFGIRAGRTEAAPVMTGSHIDTVATGGRYDGNYGVLAGLEVVRWLNERSVVLDRPFVVAAFTNEEDVRFQPDMMSHSSTPVATRCSERSTRSAPTAHVSARSCARPASCQFARRQRAGAPSRAGCTG
jgi:hypothetical protein